MSDKTLARRSSAQVFFNGVNITQDLSKYLLSISYTDNEEDATDDLQIKLEDREGLWLEKWLEDAINAAATVKGAKSSSSSSASSTTTSQVITSYTVNAPAGVAVRSRAGDQYYLYGTLPYGSSVSVASISGGWANITYSGKNAYCKSVYLSPVYSTITTTNTTAENKAEKKKEEERGNSNLKIQAVIVRQNWNGDGKDEILECGQFELDDVTTQGPPNTVTIKATSIPYSSTVRQTAKSKSWENYTLSGIVKEMSSRNGMTYMYLAARDPSYKRVEQYKKSDITFLQKLCGDAGLSLKVSNNIIVVFDQATFESRPSVFTIERGAGKYSKYKLSAGKTDTYTSCRVYSTRPNGSVISATAVIDGYKEDDEKNQCLEIEQNVSSEAEALTVATNLLRKHNKYGKTATFTTTGDTKLVAGCTVKLKKWGAFDGTYIIKSARHTVDKSGYQVQLTLRNVVNLSFSSAASQTQQSSNIAVGSKVMINSGVSTFYDGVKMASFVPKVTLYVRAVEQGGTVLLVSTEPTANVYTGRVWASDVHLI